MHYRDIVESETIGVEEENAWHGTPHKFDQFSTEFLGSGEGFNTFGWGLYFASKREIADFYSKKLGKETGGGHLYRVNLPDEANKYLYWDVKIGKQPGPVKIAALSMLEIEATPPQKFEWGMFCTIEPNLQLSKANVESDGNNGFRMYAEDGGWDAVRSFPNMPDGIKAAKVRIRQQLLAQTGEAFYEALKREFGGAKQASLALLEKGIYGIKYFDSGSRTAKTGSYNYVIFDSSHVEIMRE